jgi:hypothetical protein
VDAQPFIQEIDYGENTMKKYPNQTCLRLPEVLKDEMSNICDTYQINESDLMRRAISEFVQRNTENPQNNGKLMFV